MPTEPRRCYHAGCTPVAVVPLASERELRLGVLDPPFVLREHDGTTTEETYCLCIANELGRRRLLMVPWDDGLFTAFFALMAAHSNGDMLGVRTWRRQLAMHTPDAEAAAALRETPDV